MITFPFCFYYLKRILFLLLVRNTYFIFKNNNETLSYLYRPDMQRCLRLHSGKKVKAWRPMWATVVILPRKYGRRSEGMMRMILYGFFQPSDVCYFSLIAFSPKTLCELNPNMLALDTSHKQGSDSSSRLVKRHIFLSFGANECSRRRLWWSWQSRDPEGLSTDLRLGKPVD